MSDTEPIQLEAAPNLDRVAQQVNDICRSATFDLSFRIGQLIIKELFVDSTQLWERGGVRSTSYRALAARGDLLLSASALCRAVGIYVLIEQLGGWKRWQHLSTSHFQEVLSLDPESRAMLLIAAEENQWSVSRMRAEVREYRGQRHGGGTGGHVRTLKRLGSRLANCQEILSSVDLSEAEEGALHAIRNAVHELHAQLAQLSAAVELRPTTTPRQSHVRELMTHNLPSVRHR